MVRILLAGVLGGIVVFVCGAVEHMVFGWGGREFQQLKNDSAIADVLKGQQLEHGIYMFPGMLKDVPKEQAEKDFTERYKTGPNGLLVIDRTGEEPMGPQQLGFEALSNILAALIAAWIVSLLAPTTDFYTRWLVVFCLGLMAWLSLSASYAIWYRFPWPFIRDELFCALFEWGVAGLVIAAIAKPAKTGN